MAKDHGNMKAKSLQHGRLFDQVSCNFKLLGIEKNKKRIVQLCHYVVSLSVSFADQFVDIQNSTKVQDNDTSNKNNKTTVRA